jgi:hypothetical protein
MSGHETEASPRGGGRDWPVRAVVVSLIVLYAGYAYALYWIVSAVA